MFICWCHLCLETLGLADVLNCKITKAFQYFPWTSTSVVGLGTAFQRRLKCLIVLSRTVQLSEFTILIEVPVQFWLPNHEFR